MCVRWTATQPSSYFVAQKCTSHYDIYFWHRLLYIAGTINLCVSLQGTRSYLLFMEKNVGVCDKRLSYAGQYVTRWGWRRTPFAQNEGPNICSLSPSHEEKRLKQQPTFSDCIRQTCEQRDCYSVAHSSLLVQAYRTVAGQRVIVSSFALAITLHTNRTISILSYIPKREGGNGWVGGLGWVE